MTKTNLENKQKAIDYCLDWISIEKQKQLGNNCFKWIWLLQLIENNNINYNDFSELRDLFIQLQFYNVTIGKYFDAKNQFYSDFLEYLI